MRKMVPLKILIVDDSPSSRKIIREELSSLANAEIYEAESGREAMSLAIELEPDAITMDVEMPEIDGITTIQRIRYYPQCSHIPIIVISSKEEPNLNARAFHAGAVEFIRKPFAPGSLKEYLEELLADESSLEDINILVVDDSRSIRTILARILRKRGARVLDAANGEEAIALLEQHPVDLVVTDFVMPKMDGIELCRTIRGPLDRPELPVIILTAAGEYSVVIEALKAGANDYLVKPFSREEMLARLENHARLVRHQRDSVALQRQLVQSTKLSSLGSIATGLAHEINNPLGIIKLSVSGAMGQLEKRPEKVRGSLERIDEHVDRIAVVIQQLRHFAQVSNQTDFVEEDPRNLARATSDLHRQQFVGRGIELLEEYTDEPCTIRCIPGQVQHVLVEVVSNARDAFQHFNGPKQLILRVYRNEDQVYLEVEDTGPGIPKKLLQRIEDPFFTTKEAGKGTGLGLSICRSIIADQDGVFHLQSKENHGTLVQIIFPVVSP